MISNLLEINNLIPIAVCLVMCLLIDKLYENKKILALFRRNETINEKELFSVGQFIQGFISTGLFIALSIVILTQIRHGIYNNTLLRTFGFIYLSSDIMAMVKAKKLLQKQTIYHHYAVAIMALLILCIDFNNSSIGNLIIAYCITSTGASSVHFYLSLRLYYSVKKLGFFCFYNYIFTFTANMTYHALNLPLNLVGLAYAVTALPLVWADISLLRSLNRTKNL